MKVASYIEDLIPYKPGKSLAETKREYGLEQIYKLASNESPIAPSAKIIDAMKRAVETVHHYPDPSAYELCQVLSKKWDVDPSWIGIGNGSNEIIDLLIRAFCQPGDKVLTSERAFIAYRLCAQATGVNTVQLPMNDKWEFDLESFPGAVDDKTKLVFVANPNNPTGTYTSKTRLIEFLDAMAKKENTLVVLDEAYNEFVRAEDFIDGTKLMKSYPNLVVLRTLSKVYGLAGLRIGALIAQPEHIQYFHRIRNPFNVNSIAQAAALAAMDDEDFLAKAQQMCWQGLDYYYEELKGLGVDFVPSQANFVLFDARQDSRVFFEACLKKGVILRPVVEYGLPTHIRMSVGDDEANRAAISVIKELMT